MQDRYGNSLSTTSAAARDAYVEAVDLFLAAQTGAEEAFNRAISEDPSFALAHVDLARALQTYVRPAEAVAALEKAQLLSPGANAREQRHISIMADLIRGNGAAAFAGIADHVTEHPRDAMVVQPAVGVFGLIGFSGRSGREAEQLAFLAPLATHYGEDWWFDGSLAFAQVEIGMLSQADALVTRSLQANPRNANAAHYRAHVQYEQGERAAGLVNIRDWRKDYDPNAMLYCHIAWHEAIWALESGNTSRAWEIVENEIRPGKVWGPPLNILTDTIAFLLRAELAGEPRRNDLWKDLSDYAAKFFPNPGISFGDAHSAIAHAMAGNSEALAKFTDNPAGPAGDVVKTLADTYDAFVRQDWQTVVSSLAPVMASHERLGGSRAQRDFIELTLLSALLKLGRAEEATRLLIIRRPHNAGGNFVAGL